VRLARVSMLSQQLDPPFPPSHPSPHRPFHGCVEPDLKTNQQSLNWCLSSDVLNIDTSTQHKHTQTHTLESCPFGSSSPHHSNRPKDQRRGIPCAIKVRNEQAQQGSANSSSGVLLPTLRAMKNYEKYFLRAERGR
jgi:hypothetical protein